MNSALKISLVTATCFVVAAGVVQNFRHQWETERQLNDLQKQVAAGATPHETATPATAPAAQTPGAAVVQINDDANQVEYVKKQQNILLVMDAGWKLIDKRSVAAATQAADIFQDGLKKIDDKSPDLYNGLGRALLIAGKNQEAIDAWTKGLTYAPKFADMQSGIGWAHWRMNDPYHAKEAWEAAVAVDPKCVDAWSALAWIDMALGNKEQSVKGFQALIAFDSTRQAWTTGLSMARAGNRDVGQINSLFRLPPLETFNSPPATMPSDAPVSASIPASF